MQKFVIMQLGIRGKLMQQQSPFVFMFPFMRNTMLRTARRVTYKLLTRILKDCRDDAKLVYTHLMIDNAHVSFS